MGPSDAVGAGLSCLKPLLGHVAYLSPVKSSGIMPVGLHTATLACARWSPEVLGRAMDTQVVLRTSLSTTWTRPAAGGTMSFRPCHAGLL